MGKQDAALQMTSAATASFIVLLEAPPQININLQTDFTCGLFSAEQSRGSQDLKEPLRNHYAAKI